MTASTVPAGARAPLVEGRGLRLACAGRAVVDDVDITCTAGQVVGVVGPNGSGKTSVLRMLAGAQRPGAGEVLVDGHPVGALAPRELARLVAVVAQDELLAESPMTVADLVLLGRAPHLGPFARPGAADLAAVEDALRRVGALDLARREVATLSGGERQRVLVARALAQGARTLLLDEPTNHLDVRFQHEVLGLARSVVAGGGAGCVVVLHDLNLAARYCDHLLVLDAGRAVAVGRPGDVLRPEVLEPVYRVGVHRLDLDGVPHLAFHPAHETHGAPHEHLT